jgi:gas vesicle protein
MKRNQLVALIAGATLGIAAVTIGIILAREDGREAARRFLNENQIGQKSQQAAQAVASTARKVSNQVAQTAQEQYPRAKNAVSNAISQAPQAVGAISSALPKGLFNGKPATTTEGELPEASI